MHGVIKGRQVRREATEMHAAHKHARKALDGDSSSETPVTADTEGLEGALDD